MGKIFLAVIVAVIVLGIIEIWREQKTFGVTKYSIFTRKVNGRIKAVFLSDLHNQFYGTHNSRLLAEIEKAQPDLILVGGDMLIGRRTDSFDEAVMLIRAVSAIAPVYYGLGNHEQRMLEETEIYGDMYERYISMFKGYDIHILINETALIRVRDQSIKITGLNILSECYTKGIAKRDFLLSELESCIGKKDSEDYHILLAHNPAYIHTYRKWGADLTLSGHMHGGVVRIPGVGGLMSPQMKLFPEYSGGHYHIGDREVVVSRGLGGHTMNFRLFNLPELIILQLETK